MDAQLARAVANALWPAWRRDRWQRSVCTRDFARSNPRGYSALHSGTVPMTPAARTTLVTHEEAWLEAVLLAEEWPGTSCVTCGGQGEVEGSLAWTNGGFGGSTPYRASCVACGGSGVATASYCVRLTRAAHDRVVFMLSSEERVALASVRHSTARAPFTVETNRHGRRKLRRNQNDPLVTAAAANALEALASAALLARVDEETVDAFLLDGSETCP
jgi:hypothetical protein